MFLKFDAKSIYIYPARANVLKLFHETGCIKGDITEAVRDTKWFRDFRPARTRLRLCLYGSWLSVAHDKNGKM